ncbi:MAG TPA: DUF1326 domain-containing protein [Thermoanaerobaculia bacterium]|nr:DUF1326 domain-containing protein [Thermoanaerobaculia bacterium]
MIVAALLLLAASASVPPPVADEHWTIAGELAESCTCAIPCTCQFGQGPSPGPGCRSLTVLSIERGSRGAVSLAQTRMGIAFGPKGTVVYLDAAGDPAREEALRAIAGKIASTSGFRIAAVVDAPIRLAAGEGTTEASVGEVGSFAADVLRGFDGKSPVVVENNLDINVPRLEKGKTTGFRYRDAIGNAVQTSGTNSSRGRFEWSDATAAFFR